MENVQEVNLRMCPYCVSPVNRIKCFKCGTPTVLTTAKMELPIMSNSDIEKAEQYKQERKLVFSSRQSLENSRN